MRLFVVILSLSFLLTSCSNKNYSRYGTVELGAAGQYVYSGQPIGYEPHRANNFVPRDTLNTQKASDPLYHLSQIFDSNRNQYYSEQSSFSKSLRYLGYNSHFIFDYDFDSLDFLQEHFDSLDDFHKGLFLYRLSNLENRVTITAFQEQPLGKISRALELYNRQVRKELFLGLKQSSSSYQISNCKISNFDFKIGYRATNSALSKEHIIDYFDCQSPFGNRTVYLENRFYYNGISTYIEIGKGFSNEHKLDKTQELRPQYTNQFTPHTLASTYLDMLSLNIGQPYTMSTSLSKDFTSYKVLGMSEGFTAIYKIPKHLVDEFINIRKPYLDDYLNSNLKSPSALTYHHKFSSK